MNVAFRADASSAIGAGHISRCLTLAESLRQRGARTTMICAAGSDEYAPRLADVVDRVVGLPHTAAEFADPTAPIWLAVSEAEDAEATLAALDADVDWLVVDHYGLGIAWESRLRSRARRILAIDDLADRAHDCDVLLDQNLRPDGAYDGLVPATARVLQGPRHALLRPEFAIGARRHPRTAVRRVLVSFGGVDAADGTSSALDALDAAALPGVEVDVIIGARHPNRAEVERRCSGRDRSCHVQTTRIAELMDSADLGIGAAGASSWERCAMGLPSIMVTMAENQAPIADAIAALGAGVSIGAPSADSTARMAGEIRRLHDNGDALRSMSTAAYGVIGERADVAGIMCADARS